MDAESIRLEIESLTEAHRTLLGVSEAEHRPHNEEENAQLDMLEQQITAQRLVLRRAEFAAGEPSQAPSPTPAVPARRPATTQPIVTAGRGGFTNRADFLRAVHAAAGGQIDARLRNELSTLTGPSGGFAIPVDYRTEIMERINFARTFQVMTTPTSSNAVTMAINEDEPWSGQVQAGWIAELQDKPVTEPRVGLWTAALKKLAAIVVASDEVLEDAPRMESLLRSSVPAAMAYQLEDAYINGNGTTQPLGVLNSPALLTVAASTNTPAGGITFEDVINLYTAMWGPRRSSAVWMINPMLEVQLYQMAFAQRGQDPATILSPVPVFLPPNGVVSSPYATLMGRPVIPHPAMAAPGTVGDILFASWDQYQAIVKSGVGDGIRFAESIHVRFISDATVFRFVMRVGGAPLWSRPISFGAGGFQQSSFVTLGAR